MARLVPTNLGWQAARHALHASRSSVRRATHVFPPQVPSNEDVRVLTEARSSPEARVLAGHNARWPANDRSDHPPRFLHHVISKTKSQPARQRICFSIGLLNGTMRFCYIVTFCPLTFPPFSHRLSHNAQGRAWWFLQFHLFVFPIVFPFPFSRSFSLFPFPDRFPFSLFPFPFSPGGNFVFPWW